jgi:hypothetical protein
MADSEKRVLKELDGLFNERVISTKLVINITTSVLRPMLNGFTTTLNENSSAIEEKIGLTPRPLTPLPEKFVKIPDVKPTEYGIHDVEILLDFYDEIRRKGEDVVDMIDDPEKEAALNDINGIIEASKTAMDTIESGEEFKKFLEYEGREYLRVRDLVKRVMRLG